VGLSYRKLLLVRPASRPLVSRLSSAPIAMARRAADEAVGSRVTGAGTAPSRT